MRALLLATLIAVPVVAEEPVVTLESTVTGNQEQPKVLTIVPWQGADGPDSLYQDFSSRIDNLFDPVARRTFQREMQLRERYDTLSQQAAGD